MTNQQQNPSTLRSFKRFPSPAVMPAAKHPQFILALDYTAFKNLDVFWTEDKGTVHLFVPQPSEQENVFASLQEHLVLRQREWLDNSPNANGQSGQYKGDRNFKQVLPYCAFILESSLMGRAEDILIGTYRRGSGGGEARLANNISVGYGGHVDLDDMVTTNSVIDLRQTLEQSMMRELDEEVKIINHEGQRVSADTLESEFNGFIVDGTDAVGQLHVAFVSFFLVPDHYQIQSNEDELDTFKVCTVGELLNSDLPLENWTRILLNEIIARHRPTTPAEEFTGSPDEPEDKNVFVLPA